MRATRPPVGFAAVSSRDPRSGPDLGAALTLVFGEGVVDSTAPGLQLSAWGDQRLTPGDAVVLTRELRRRDERLDHADVHRLVTQADHGLGEVLPTFGAAVVVDGGITACTDALGFGHVYYRVGEGWAAVSTSARLLAALGNAAIDAEAIAVQSVLGWQLRDRTLFAGVRKLAAGDAVTARDGELRRWSFLPEEAVERVSADEAVASMRDMLRGYLGAYLDDYPDAVLQLTGGQDSRLLLSAVDERCRSDLRVVTLGRPGTPDVDIAAGIARRYGMRHELLSIDGLGDLPAEDLYERCRSAADMLELGADPLARAALDFAESRALAGPRISGLGGEVARGFYYFGRGGNTPVTEARARRLADWRMFANEAAEPDALHPEFRSWARGFATQEVARILEETREPWFAATDDLYLSQRMQRWAGVTESAVCAKKQVVNPMLDDRWIRTVGAVAPHEKSGSKFLARLQVALDEELAALPLDGRPSPATFASSNRWAGTVRRGSTLARKAARKAAQRVRGDRRSPAGGDIMAAGVVEHWRADPGTLSALADGGIVSPDWVEDVLARRRDAAPATVAFVMNCVMAQETVAAARELT